jgi:heme oxygenase
MEDQFLEELRTKTNSLHKLVEQTAVSKAIISPDLTRNQYEVYLQKAFCLHADAENKVFPVLSPYIDDIAERKKTDKITLDLKELGFPIKHQSITFIDENFISTISFCFGIMYVVEGSTLGGMHILKNIKASIGKNADVPVHFFNAYGQHTGSKWKLFLEKLNAYKRTIDSTEAAKIIDGAIYGFNRTYELFNAE